VPGREGEEAEACSAQWRGEEGGATECARKREGERRGRRGD
jgi:hypothetical protein